MALVTSQDNNIANQRYVERRRKQRREVLRQLADRVGGEYNVVGVGTFKVEGIYHVRWLVDGVQVGQSMLTIPTEECTEMTATEWFHQYVKTMMFAFDITRADILVSEVVNDTKEMHAVRTDKAD